MPVRVKPPCTDRPGRRRQVGVVDLANAPGAPWLSSALSSRQASITAQATSVWCRKAGHDVRYTFYLGLGSLEDLVPHDLDVLFVSAFTWISPMAYALARICKQRGVRSVLGGAHAQSFPSDALRFFDHVVGDCNEELILQLVASDPPRGQVLSSAPFRYPPSVRQRMPEIEASTAPPRFAPQRRTVPLLGSVGCPYTCNFCIDYNRPYLAAPKDAFAQDIEETTRQFPGAHMLFHDPNFAVRFDETLSILERVPIEKRNPFGVATSLTNMRGDRLQRIRDTRCVHACFGIESLSDYSNKSRAGAMTPPEKLEHIIQEVGEVSRFIEGTHASFIFGLDGDDAEQSFELVGQFAERVPTVALYLNTPVAYGMTPLYFDMLGAGRLLQQLPLCFYIFPWVPFVLESVDPLELIDGIIATQSRYLQPHLLERRVQAARSPRERLGFITKFAFGTLQRRMLRSWRRQLEQPDLLRFHTGEQSSLPQYYVQMYAQWMGRYAELVPLEEVTPVHEALPQEAPRALHLVS